MAGYSATPLAKKLGIKAGSKVALIDAPKGFRSELVPLPEGVRFVPASSGSLDVIVYFTVRQEDLLARFPVLAQALQPAGGLWVAWPKKASKVATDLGDGVVREIGLSFGLVDNKVCAVTEVWSGLRFVIRLKDREGWESACRKLSKVG